MNGQSTDNAPFEGLEIPEGFFVCQLCAAMKTEDSYGGPLQDSEGEWNACCSDCFKAAPMQPSQVKQGDILNLDFGPQCDPWPVIYVGAAKEGSSLVLWESPANGWQPMAAANKDLTPAGVFPTQAQQDAVRSYVK